MAGVNAQALQEGVIQSEAALYDRRAKVSLTYRDATGAEVQASVNVLMMNLTTSTDENVRRSSHEALLGLERWVVNNGFLELVGERNVFARALGFRDFFDYKVRRNERLSPEQLFTILDEFESLTRESNQRMLYELSGEKGYGVLEAHNLNYALSGDAERALDPYLPFGRSLEYWIKSFSRLGIRFRQAKLQLDLLDRRGKYENGFMHAPQPCYYNKGQWVPARINFTSNASPGQIGSGRRALITLFHEGGHAAHFSNVTMGAPCFAVEYPPMSMALAETQSMFCDSIASNPDWLAVYAGAPDDCIQRFITATHPAAAFRERSILLVPVFERRLYAMTDAERTPENVLALARDCEQKILGVKSSPRPVLAIPHLLGGESACSYQGYLLAHMAVYQALEHFKKRDGFITDNPRIGPELAEKCWGPGNSIGHSEAIQRLSGQGLSGRALASHCNRTNNELWSEAKVAIEEGRRRPQSQNAVELDADIRVVDGAEIIASSEKSVQRLIEDFERWIAARS
jgi:oligoendopeptidase F